MVWDATRALIRALQSHRWPTSEGKVVTSRVTKREADEESLESYSADIEYQYTVNGETKLSGMIGLADINDGRKAKAEALVLRYAEDSLVRVYCSPYDPDVAVLKPGLCWHHFSKLLVGLFFFTAGVTMLWGFGWWSWLVSLTNAVPAAE